MKKILIPIIAIISGMVSWLIWCAIRENGFADKNSLVLSSSVSGYKQVSHVSHTSHAAHASHYSMVVSENDSIKGFSRGKIDELRKSLAEEESCEMSEIKISHLYISMGCRVLLKHSHEVSEEGSELYNMDRSQKCIYLEYEKGSSVYTKKRIYVIPLYKDVAYCIEDYGAKRRYLRSWMKNLKIQIQ